MNEDNLIPALTNAQEEMPTELSACEFQRKLYDWFEERGMLSDLRAHLRKQMIGVLKDTAIGRTVSCHQKPTVSPKLQAVNLLIAEFLLLQDYHYSLSVFSTEVPLINVFPQFSGATLNHPETTKQWKFNEKDALDILETLSIDKNTQEGKKVLFAYFKNTKEALLSCIIRTFNSLQKKSKKPESGKNVDDLIDNLDQLWIQNVTEILISSRVSSLCADEIIKLLSQIVENEKKRLQEEAREAYLRLQEKLQQKVAEQEEEQNKKIAEIKRLLEVESNEKMKRQTEIKSFEENMQKHNNVIRDRYKKMLDQENELQERKKKVDAQEVDLKSQQKNLDAGYAKLFQEQKTVIDLQEKLQRTMEKKAADIDVKFYETIKTECKNIKTQIGETHDALTFRQVHDGGVDVLKNTMEKVQLENENLKTVNREQRQRIETLSQQASNLMRNLDISQTAIGFLNNGFALTDNPVSRTSSTSSRNRPVLRNGTTYSGAGEEVYRPTSAREYKNLLDRHDLKRRAPQRPLTVHSSSTSDDLTNNILEEARERLKRLEEESEEVDKRYKQFKKMQERNSQNPDRLKAKFQFRDSVNSTAIYSFLNARDLPSKDVAHKPGTSQNSYYQSEDNLSDRVRSSSEANHVEGGYRSHQDEESVASSNILELLAARASSASISDFEMTDGGKSDDKTNKTKSDEE